ncbi:DUF3862 domain-containing protein [Ligilactobacillus pobuzihii]|uniref:DUF3862 domain-containing protein n=1 Tax=Ligilactobacillus pobuzihii TaxID=449659 RepID=UPI0019D10EEA|nr:DUF3862 domain-containing protein [Ligilactobacillus pobuzihii]MBN7274668.1 DUF3862 domain-containing protein [Ligilactobacillus pobuzihii]
MTEKDNSIQNNKPTSFWQHTVVTLLVVIVVIFGGVFIKQQYESKNHLTQSNFNSIELSQSEGDSLDDVTELFGKDPSAVTKVQKKGVVTQVAAWQNVVDASQDSKIFIYFDDGHAVSKTIKGLKRDRTTKITRKDFDELKSGMKKGDVARKIGTPNDYTYDERFYGVSSEQWTYTGIDENGKSVGVMTLSFRNGNLAGKTQNNLK